MTNTDNLSQMSREDRDCGVGRASVSGHTDEHGPQLRFSQRLSLSLPLSLSLLAIGPVLVRFAVVAFAALLNTSMH